MGCYFIITFDYDQCGQSIVLSSDVRRLSALNICSTSDNQIYKDSTTSDYCILNMAIGAVNSKVGTLNVEYSTSNTFEELVCT